VESKQKIRATGVRVQGAVVQFCARSQHLVIEHRARRRAIDRQLSDRSRLGLDLTNFFLADVQTGFGAFLAFYLAGFGWSKGDVGLVLMVGGLAGVAAQIPGGAAADAVRWKRGLAALGIVSIAASAIILAAWPIFPMVLLAELLQGVTGGIIGPAIAAISLGLAGRRGMSLRVGRNFRFAAAGNALTALAMGAFADLISDRAIFAIAALLCIPTLMSLAFIRSDEIDYARARNAGRREKEIDIKRVADLAKNRNLLVFAGCLVVFQFANAALLPIVGENLGHSGASANALTMAGLIVVPQIVVAVLAPWIGYWSELFGRKPLLLIGLAAAPLRALLFIAVGNAWAMLAVQLLDGITGAVITVLTLLVITDLTSGTGRFNLAQGIVGTLTGISASLSYVVLGAITEYFGDVVGLTIMAAGAALAAILLWAFLPETKPAEYED
jgi:MFS family permease